MLPEEICRFGNITNAGNVAYEECLKRFYEIMFLSLE